MSTRTITVNQLAEVQRQKEIELIDVRTPVEFRQIHALGARNVPLDSAPFHQMLSERGEMADRPAYLICQSGARSSMGCQKLIDAGFENVVSVDGGTAAWEAAGLPVVKGKKAISLERQVRILAGFLAFLGAVLGLSVHPYFIGLSGFIGAGLMFAGITDTCGMGMMLAKMPWNQCKPSSCDIPATDSPAEAAK